jgi:hypothetical protein
MKREDHAHNRDANAEMDFRGFYERPEMRNEGTRRRCNVVDIAEKVGEAKLSIVDV